MPNIPEVFGGNPPQGLAYIPGQTFLVTRQLPNGNELEIGHFVQAADYSNQQAIRDVTYLFVNERKTNNPAWRILLYGPTNGGYWTADDIIWNSTLL